MGDKLRELAVGCIFFAVFVLLFVLPCALLLGVMAVELWKRAQNVP